LYFMNYRNELPKALLLLQNHDFYKTVEMIVHTIIVLITLARKEEEVI
jgi:hypothetical protein